MGSQERFRASAERIGDHHGSESVTLSRASVNLFEEVTGAVPTLTCGVAAEEATTLPLVSAEDLAGRIDAGVTIAISGHSVTYTLRAKAEPAGGNVSVSIEPGLESAVSGESLTLSPRQLSFTGGQIELSSGKVPAGWVVGSGDEIWALVPPNTDAGAEPRKGDRMTSPRDAVVAEKPAGREGVEYVVLFTGMASEEAA